MEDHVSRELEAYNEPAAKNTAYNEPAAKNTAYKEPATKNRLADRPWLKVYLIAAYSCFAISASIPLRVSYWAIAEGLSLIAT